jgi:hypothetical protein
MSNLTSLDRLIYKLLDKGWSVDAITTLLRQAPDQGGLKLRITCADLRSSANRIDQQLQRHLPSIMASLDSINRITSKEAHDGQAN